MANYWLDHIHMTSPDPVKTAEFYEKMVGAIQVESLQTSDGRTAVFLDLSGSSIKMMQPIAQPLIPGASPTDYGLDHIGVLTDNLDEAVADLKAKGVKFVREILADPHAPGRLAYFLGPENVLFELLDTAANLASPAEKLP